MPTYYVDNKPVQTKIIGFSYSKIRKNVDYKAEEINVQTLDSLVKTIIGQITDSNDFIEYETGEFLMSDLVDYLKDRLEGFQNLDYDFVDWLVFCVGDELGII